MGGRYDKQIGSGVGQLTLVEHALCPIDSRASLIEQFRHDTTFNFTDKDRNRRSGRVRVLCPLGLSPQDEIFLWGLLALTLADPSNGGELHATRHYLLRRLGMIDANARRGGRQYQRFTESIDRLAAVQYFNDSFYDPIRSEHVRVNFKFFSYILPADPKSSRAWRIVWDPVFFSFAKAARGALWFDFERYGQLSVAGRRLYLFASKLLARRDTTFPIDAGDLVFNVLGYSTSLAPFEQNARIRSCLRELVELGILRADQTRLCKQSKGRYYVILAQGKVLRQRRKQFEFESPLIEPLCDLGFEQADARRLLSRFSTVLVREWIDITLAAKERFGMVFFRRSPAAYLRSNLNRAAAGTGTPPDWWHEIRKAEERARAARARKRRSTQTADQLPQKAMDSLENVREDIFSHFLAAGQSEKQAAENARRVAASASRSSRSSDDG